MVRRTAVSTSVLAKLNVNSLQNQMLLVVAANKKPIHHDAVYEEVYQVDAETQHYREINDRVSPLRALKRKGLVETTKPATYKITVAGREFVKQLKKAKSKK